ncbi:hypothetical protein CIHG_06198 [Coccidioides immitis H538.4]|uniref:Uncharacterized protein n=1 Tax=Coccidioides immitis H538.4 TaxID=396776 RepID=A0A0J8RT55_COCIT|nr:hypothetical protein CIHG_06198 [Coccidioides immitis H538.4]
MAKKLSTRAILAAASLMPVVSTVMRGTIHWLQHGSRKGLLNSGLNISVIAGPFSAANSSSESLFALNDNSDSETDISSSANIYASLRHRRPPPPPLLVLRNGVKRKEWLVSKILFVSNCAYVWTGAGDFSLWTGKAMTSLLESLPVI